jgi:hypothetical protein
MHDDYRRDIAVEFRPLDPSASEIQQDSPLTALFPGARWVEHGARGPGADVVAMILTGTISLKVAVTAAVKLTCQVRKRGLIIDLTRDKFELRETRNLPGGTVIIVARGRKTEQYNVCEDNVDLGATVNRLLHPPQ